MNRDMVLDGVEEGLEDGGMGKNVIDDWDRGVEYVCIGYRNGLEGGNLGG